jgi:hypothetical protein
MEEGVGVGVGVGVVPPASSYQPGNYKECLCGGGGTEENGEVEVEFYARLLRLKEENSRRLGMMEAEMNGEQVRLGLW